LRQQDACRWGSLIDEEPPVKKCPQNDFAVTCENPTLRAECVSSLGLNMPVEPLGFFMKQKPSGKDLGPPLRQNNFHNRSPL
jgi:hypothetical protein